jgi:predicted phosphohydrolase
MPIRIVCVSDTHRMHDGLVVPEGDLLVHAGDSTKRGRLVEIEEVDRWLGTLPHPHKVIIAGNHDFAFERGPEARARITHATYLQDELATVLGLRIWGSPWQPRFFDWAFNADRGRLWEKWALIPADVDVLVTHGPPMGILDVTASGEHVGCEELLRELDRVRPRLHVFGHIHEAYGIVRRGETTFVNASTCDLSYQPVQPPIVVDLDPR